MYRRMQAFFFFSSFPFNFSVVYINAPVLPLDEGDCVLSYHYSGMGEGMFCMLCVHDRHIHFFYLTSDKNSPLIFAILAVKKRDVK